MQLKWYQISLRSSLVLLMLTCFLIWLSVESNRVASVREARATIEQLGGGVEYEYHFDFNTNTLSIAPEPQGPDALNRLLGEDYFNEIRHVDFTGLIITDKDLRVLSQLPNITLLSLGYTELTDKGLAVVANLKHLKSLGLENTQISDDGIASLEGLESLEELNLDGTRVSDRCLASLAKLRQLRYLYVSHTQVSEDGVAWLRNALPNCSIER